MFPLQILRNKRFLETVAVAAQDMAKTTEQRRQESLKRISSEVHELKQKLKKVKLDCGDGDPNDGYNYCCVNGAQPVCDSFEDSAWEKCQLQVGSMEQMIQSCVELQNFCQGLFAALIELVSEVGQPREDNAKCIGQLFDFTKELRDQLKTLFSKIEFVHNQDLDENQAIQIEELEKWKRMQKEQVEGVEKLLSSLLQQGSMDRRQSHGKMERQVIQVTLSLVKKLCPVLKDFFLNFEIDSFDLSESCWLEYLGGCCFLLVAENN